MEPLLGEPRHEYNTDEDGQPEEEWKANPIDLILNAIDAVLPDDQDFDTQVTSYLIRAAAYRYLGEEEKELGELRSLTWYGFDEDGHGADRLQVPRSTLDGLLNPYPGLRWYDYGVTQG